MGDLVIILSEYFKKDVWKNTLLCGLILSTSIISYSSICKSNKISNLLENVNDLTIEKNNLLKETSLLSEKIDFLEKNNFDYNEVLLLNSNNWNYLFENNLYNIYKNSEMFGEYITFPNTAFYDLVNTSCSNFVLFENNLKSLIFKNMYNLKPGEILINPINEQQVRYVIFDCFRKLKILNEDKIINTLLYNQHGNNQPYYSPGVSALNHILKEKNHLPLSYDLSYIKKYSAFDWNKNFHYSVFNISKFE